MTIPAFPTLSAKLAALLEDVHAARDRGDIDLESRIVSDMVPPLVQLGVNNPTVHATSTFPW